MQRYDDPDLQDLLTGEFVLGNLRGAARRRFVTLMQRNAGLRERVQQWEERMYPWFARVAPVKAPKRVWQNIHARISPRAAKARTRRTFWTGFATAVSLGALAALWFAALAPLRPPQPTMIAVLQDRQARAAILASWTIRPAAQQQLALRILAHPDMPADTSWQAWLILADGTEPLSLGLVTAEPNQVLAIPEAVARALPRAVGIAVSVETKGGSKSGRPSGPFVFEGQAVRADG